MLSQNLIASKLHPSKSLEALRRYREALIKVTNEKAQIEAKSPGLKTVLADVVEDLKDDVIKVEQEIIQKEQSQGLEISMSPEKRRSSMTRCIGG